MTLELVGRGVLSGIDILATWAPNDKRLLRERKLLVKNSWELTPKGRKMAVARAARMLMLEEWEIENDKRHTLAEDALYEQGGDMSLEEFLAECDNDEELLEKARIVREAQKAVEAVEAEMPPSIKLRDAEVWLMQRKLEGKL